jgi:hypothetical protein
MQAIRIRLQDSRSDASSRRLKHTPTGGNADQQQPHHQECHREVGCLSDEANRRWGHQDTGIAKSGNRGDGDVLRHDFLPTDRRVEDWHDIRATCPDEREPQNASYPVRTQRSQGETGRRTQAANDEHTGTADPRTIASPERRPTVIISANAA